MNEVNVKLSNDDRRAIDLLLDRGPAATTGTNGFHFQTAQGMTAAYHPHATPAHPDSIGAVQQVLDLLSLMPAEDPPADLVARTLARVDASTRAVAVEQVPFRLQADPTLPPA